MHRLFLGQLEYALLVFRTAWLCVSVFQDSLIVQYLFSGYLSQTCIACFQDILVSSALLVFRTAWLEVHYFFSGQLG